MYQTGRLGPGIGRFGESLLSAISSRIDWNWRLSYSRWAVNRLDRWLNWAGTDGVKRVGGKHGRLNRSTSEQRKLRCRNAAMKSNRLADTTEPAVRGPSLNVLQRMS